MNDIKELVVKIIGASSSGCWYEDRIGEVVSVYSGVRYGRYVVKRDYDLPGARLIRLIEEQDCEVVYEIVGDMSAKEAT